MAAPDPAPQLFKDSSCTGGGVHTWRGALGAAQGRARGLLAGRMLARKPPMLVMVALANKMARIAWALITKGGSYRAPAVAA